MGNKESNMQNDYADKTHRIGKISDSIAILLILAVPAIVTLVYGEGVEIDVSRTLSAIITLSAIYGVVSVVEVVSYSPFLGSGGTYLSFITGNIMNMKLPVATNALRVNNVERGTEEGEVIATLAIGASSIVTTIILFFGMLFLGNFLVPIITSESLAPAFNNVTPALTGALAIPYFAKNKKLSIPSVCAGVVLYVVFGYSFMSSNYSYFMLGFIVVCFLCYLLAYRLGIVKEDKK